MKTIKYLGVNIVKRKNIRGNIVYEVKDKVPQKTLLGAKRAVITEVTKSKGLRLLERSALRKKVSKIKTLTDLNREISNLNKPMATKKKTTKKATPRKEGVKADGTLKKGYRYVKGGRVVKAKATTTKRKTTAKRKTTKKR